MGNFGQISKGLFEKGNRIAKKIERDLEHARMNFMNFHQSEPDNENQELQQRQFTVNVQFDPVSMNLGFYKLK